MLRATIAAVTLFVRSGTPASERISRGGDTFADGAERVLTAAYGIGARRRSSSHWSRPVNLRWTVLSPCPTPRTSGGEASYARRTRRWRSVVSVPSGSGRFRNATDVSPVGVRV